MDLNTIVIGGIGVFLLLGLIVICIGVFIRKYNIQINKEAWRKQMVSWQIMEQGDVSSSVAEHLTHSFAYILSFAFIYGGCSVILVMLTEVVVSWYTTGSLLILFVLSAMPWLAMNILSLVMGMGIGSVIGIWKLHRATSKVGYSDLWQRQSSDYRTLLWRWVPAALIAWMLLLTALLMPHMGSTMRVEMMDGESIILSNNLWIWSIIALMLLILLACDLLVTRIALVSRVLVMPDPVMARRADDMLRSTVIGTVQQGELAAIGYLGAGSGTGSGIICVQQGELAAIGYLGQAQCILLMYNLWSGHIWHLQQGSILSLLLIVGWLLALIVFLLGVAAMPLLRGRLGGKVNGWPWHKGVA